MARPRSAPLRREMGRSGIVCVELGGGVGDYVFCLGDVKMKAELGRVRVRVCAARTPGKDASCSWPVRNQY